MTIKTEHVRFNCEKMGNVILIKNTPVKKGAKFPSRIEGCDHSEECGVGLPFTEEKCESVRKTSRS